MKRWQGWVGVAILVAGCSQQEPAALDKVAENSSAANSSAAKSESTAPTEEPKNESESLDSPAAAVQKLEQAYRAADFEALLGIYAQPYAPLLVEWNKAAELTAAEMTLANALQTHFGGQATKSAPPSDPAEELKRLVGVKIKDQRTFGEEVRLILEFQYRQPESDKTVSTTETMVALKQEGNWRLLPMAVKMQGLETVRRALEERRQAAERLQSLAVAVETGQYRTIEDVRTAIDAAVSMEQTARVSRKP